ncbi:glycoside hydrolase family 13 protein [Sphingobacterium tabacisoli]|uniref:Glycoside hydrolase family 13 protein n=1 Tax=Sphingobacterium tabacisoli TaxID=2044855 RepID=A0ABW5LA55_9SPHI|nr:glycoside hydrolase family 13 protein [Sphingobacterium tabacisoli]
MKIKLFFILLAALCVSKSYAQPLKEIKIEPISWWAGMENPFVQLTIYGKDINKTTVEINYPGVNLIRVHQVENSNYLFADLEISKDAKAGLVPIKFSQNGKVKFTYNYPIGTKSSAAGIQGVNNSDLIYQILPDRFSNGDKRNDIVPNMRETGLNRDSMYYRHGGDLQGIINKLDYIYDLGATAIWLTPVLENNMEKASYHGYAITDHYKIDPRFGTNEQYKSFVEKCHQKGIKVIKDIIHNHFGDQHWTISDLPFKDWVHQWPSFTQTTYKDQTVFDPYASSLDKKKMVNGWFVKTMPDMNQENTFVQNYITQHVIWWVEYARLDGLRLDTYPYNYLPYMKEWAERMKLEYPNLSIFGEALVNSNISQAYFSGGNKLNQGIDTSLPGVIDVSVKDAIYESINGQFGWTTGVNSLYSTLAEDFIYVTPENNVVFLDNHDLSRSFSILKENLSAYKSAYTILLTTRGIPQTYYGFEILMKNFCDPDGLVRSDFPGGWQEDRTDKFTHEGRSPEENEFFNHFKTLANYRKKTSALQTGKLMQFVPEDGVYTYFRYDSNKTIMVIVNPTNQIKTLDTARFKERLQESDSAMDVLENKIFRFEKQMDIPANKTMVLELL